MTREPESSSENSNENVADAVPEKETAERAPVFKKLAKRFEAGARNITAGMRHTVTTGNQADEEIRRILVERQLNREESKRDSAREELEEVRSRITKLERRGAEVGWSQGEKNEIKSLRAERTRREAAFNNIIKQKFVPVQPTADQIKWHRRRSTTARTTFLACAIAVAGAAVVAAPAILWLAVPGMAAGLWIAGNRPPALEQRAIPERLLRPELDIPDIAETAVAENADVETDMRGVQSTELATTYIRTGLLLEGVKIREMHGATRTAWGWEATTVLKSGTSEDIVRVLRGLDTRYRVGTGRTMAAGNPDDGAEVTMRILTSDPFASPPPYPVRAPRSCSIMDAFSPIVSLNGDETPIVLGGLHVLVVADTGGGKSALVRSLAEYTTACRDAVAIDIDPTGRGLGPLRKIAHSTAYTAEEAEKRLAWLVNLARRRIRLLPETQDNWEVSPDAPAIITFLDEYPQLTKEGKSYALELLRIGRKARITLVICTQDATSDIMGDAVADAFGIRILLPCRKADVAIVVGRDKAISEGWLPHLLVPGDQSDPGDAGQCYVVSHRHRTPILRYVIPLDAATALQRAEERAEAGMVKLDAKTLGEAESENHSAEESFTEMFLAAFGDSDSLTVVQIIRELAQRAPDSWGYLAKSLDAAEEEPEETRTQAWTAATGQAGRELRAALRAEGIAVTTVRLAGDGRPTGYRLADVRAALDG